MRTPNIVNILIGVVGPCGVDVEPDGGPDMGVVDGVWTEGSVVVPTAKVYFNYMI